MEELDPTALGATRVLAVGAHPDDAEFYAGGTLARLADAGAHVGLVVCTGGGRGGRDLDEPVAARAAEQEAAAAHVPFHERVNLGREDGELVNDDALRERLVWWLRRVRPDVVVTHDPRAVFAPVRDRFRLQHSDHRAAGQGLLDSVYPRAASPNFFQEQLAGAGLRTWFPREVWLMDTAEPTVRVDVTKTLERKLDALRAHASQNLDDSLVRAARSIGPAEEFVRLVLRRGEWRG
ncbi:MAG TPA: PIG-L deacetylase family protein [Myxococcota bacterium]|nr:PIG-L deacetylase family protein [Myxococcota bacterium]